MLIRNNNKELLQKAKKLRNKASEIVADYDLKEGILTLTLKFFKNLDTSAFEKISMEIEFYHLWDFSHIIILEDARNVIFDYILKDFYFMEPYKKNLSGLTLENGEPGFLSTVIFRNKSGKKFARYDKICFDGFDNVGNIIY